MLTVDDYLALPAARPDLRHAYGGDPQQFGDLYLPGGPGPHPVALLIHGGCWRAAYGLEPLGPLAEALRGAGWAVWSIEYRRLGSGGGWPTTLADVADGAEALGGLAPAHGLDLGRVVAIGHSAGGHLALWLAARGRVPPASPLWRPAPLPIARVVALAALADLAEAHRRGLCGTAVGELLGGGPDERPERYAAASPAALGPLGVAEAHVVGELDPIVPPDYLRAYVAAAGGEASLAVVPGAGHFEVVAPGSSAWPAVLAALGPVSGPGASQG